LNVGIAPGRRAIVPHANQNGGFNTVGEDLLINAIIWTAGIDTDGDSVDDHLDLDSDNDGVYDAVEAGHDQLQTDGRVNVPVGLDGVPDSVQDPGQEDSGLVNYILQDSDSDVVFDFRESDSDDDGCNDADEAYGDVDTDMDDNGFFGTGIPAIGFNGEITSASYSVPLDNDSNSVFDYRQTSLAPNIDVQPVNVTVFAGNNASLSATTSNANTFQWQIFDGLVWADLTNTAPYSGVTTNTLLITNATLTENGTEYRLLVSNSSYICTTEISDEVTLTVRTGTVITNRRITFRVNRN